MKIHSQSSIRFDHNEKKDFLFKTQRHYHTALDSTQCPRCEARPGAQCRDLGPLDVHHERQVAAL